jgi:hypothetical protein
MRLQVSRLPFTDTHVHFFDMREPELAYDFLGPGGDPDRTAFVGDYSAMRAERYWADDFIAEAPVAMFSRPTPRSCLTFPRPSSAHCSVATQTVFFDWRERGRHPSLLSSQRSGELLARADTELEEHLAQVPFDGARAEE